MVPTRGGDDARGGDGLAEQAMEGAAGLEGAGVLVELELQGKRVRAPTQARRQFEHRRPADESSDAFTCLLDLGPADRLHHATSA